MNSPGDSTAFNGDAWMMTRPCRTCGNTSTGYLRTSNGQDTVYCRGPNGGQAEHYAGYNAPRRETGRGTRPLSTRPGIPVSQRSRILERDNATCVICHRTDIPLDVGHLISETEGRNAGLTDRELYDDENLAAMCAPCNSGQSRRSLPLRFAIALLTTRIQAQATPP
jgi:5-methylcytosine-specific restriction endonuclease McrA